MYKYVKIPYSPFRAKWRLFATYNETVELPKEPGMLAVEVVVADDAARDFEMDIFKSRGDVNVEVTQVGP